MKYVDRIVVITGAGNGIGRELALGFAAAGAKIVAADLDASACEATARHIHESGGKAISVPTDMRKPEQIVQLIDQAVSAYGTIHIVINNAGIGRWRPPFDLTLEEWDDVINTNLRGTFLCSREAAKIMKANPEGGSIINIASTRAIMSEANSEAYAASKGGIVALTHALAVSLGESRIRVNSISPGWIETGDYSALREVDHAQHPAARVGKPSDILKACLFLSDPDNDFITGTNLVVDGGMTVKMMYEP